MFRNTAVRFRYASVDAVVVGAGPAGLCAVGNLLRLLPQSRAQQQLWIDPAFQAGRINACYREVPSNTRVDLFLQFANAITPFRQINEHASTPNAVSELRGLEQDQGCKLGQAADMCLMLTNGLATQFPRVKQHYGVVTGACLSKSTRHWTVEVDGQEMAKTPRLILCTGCSPILELPLAIRHAAHLQNPNISLLHLDKALKPSLLATILNPNLAATIAVVGASHSAILVLMNLSRLATTSHPHLRMKWFSRHRNLRYAKPMDGWILHDNTGLKGEAAKWALENLEDGVFDSSPVRQVIKRVKLPTQSGEEGKIYHAELPSCTHIVQAIGYQRDPLPLLHVMEQEGSERFALTPLHDGLTGRFVMQCRTTDLKGQNVQYIPGLFGAGIAFPERVTDPAGNVESAVGLWKFMKFLDRVVPHWVSEPSLEGCGNDR